MKKTRFSPAEREALKKLAAMAADEIDTNDIPEAPAANWNEARRGELYRPVKEPVTIRLDSDVVAWFRDHARGRGYQTEINRVLRQHVASVGKKASKRRA